MRAAAAAEEFEQATLERNRLRAVRSLLERRRVANESVGTLRRGRRGASTGATPTRRSSRSATACSPTASPSTSPTRPSATSAEVAEEFMLQYYGGGTRRSRRCWSSSASSAERPALAEALASRRGGPVELRAAERGEKRRILELAERNARLALDQERLRAERRRQTPRGGARGPAAGARPRRSRRSGSSASTSPTSAAPTRSPRWSCSRAARRRSPTTAASRSAPLRGLARRLRLDGRGARAALRPVGAPGRHLAARPRLRRELRRAAQPGRDRRRQGPARAPGSRRCAGFRERGVAVDLAGQAHRGDLHPRPRARRCVLDHSTPELQLLQRVRDEAHRFAITHHRTPPRPGDDELAARRAARRRPGAQARAAAPLRLARGGRRGLPRGAAGGARAAGEGRAASCTGTCTAPAERERRCRGIDAIAAASAAAPQSPEMAVIRPLRPRSASAPSRTVREARRRAAAAGPRGDHGLLRRGQVDGDERVRGRRLLLRRQPAAGDDPLAGGAVRARGLEGRARRRRLRRARRRLLRGAAARSSTTSTRSA